LGLLASRGAARLCLGRELIRDADRAPHGLSLASPANRDLANHEKIGCMSDFIPKPGNGIKIGGLGPKAARLQALRDKAAQKAAGGKQHFDATGAPVKAKSNFAGGKKPNFNRKAV